MNSLLAALHPLETWRKADWMQRSWTMGMSGLGMRLKMVERTDDKIIHLDRFFSPKFSVLQVEAELLVEEFEAGKWKVGL